MKALVLGCGSIGRRHIGNLTRLGCRVTAFDPDPKRAAWAAKNLGCGLASSVEAGLDARPQVAWVCTPPRFHEAPAIAAIKRSIPCFIEKPLAHDEKSARAIVAAAKRRKVSAAVGYQLRRHPALRAIKAGAESGRWGRLLFLRAQVGQYLPDWRPWQDYRESYTARRSMGGGILLDASHELDLALWLGGPVSSVYCCAKRVSSLEIDVEDTAAVTLEFRSGAIGEVHLDMVSRAYRRSLEASFEKAVVVWDQAERTLSIYSAASKKWSRKRYDFDFKRLYVEEARAFLRGGESVSLAEGLAAMQVVAAAARSARGGRKERINP